MTKDLADLYESKYVALYNRCLRTKNSRLNILKRHLANVFYDPSTLKPWTGDGCAIPWERTRETAGYRWMRIHDLRHAHGIKLAESGEHGMHVISEVLGHHSVDFTRKFYARFSPDSASRAVLKVLSKDAGRARTGTEVAQGVTK